MSQDIANCAVIVQRGDPDRFLAAMAASGAVRDRLMVLFAFNVEVSRAPWVTAEPMIAEMRLQWWLDAIEEIYSGGSVRRHEVVTPLAELVAQSGLQREVLDGIVTARRWDIYKEPHGDDAALWGYLADTGGALMGASVAVSGGDFDVAKEYGTGCAVANLLLACPALESAGRFPLVDGTTQGVKMLASGGLDRMDAARKRLRQTPSAARAALRAGWLARGILRQVVVDPLLVVEGGLGPSDAVKKLRLMGLAATGRF